MSKIVHVFKTLRAVEGQLFSATYGTDPASAVKYGLGLETRGLVVCGQRTPLFAFTSLDRAISFTRAYGNRVYECLAEKSSVEFERMPFADNPHEKKILFWKTRFVHKKIPEHAYFGNSPLTESILCKWIIPIKEVHAR